jgi:hypothetical protein
MAPPLGAAVAACPPRDSRVTERASPARHEVPEVDVAALEAARAADRALAAAQVVGADRWARYLAPLPDRLRDDPIAGLHAVARRARSAYGPKDSIRDALPPDATEPLLRAVDRLLKVLARHELEAR